MFVGVCLSSLIPGWVASEELTAKLSEHGDALNPIVSLFWYISDFIVP